VQVFTPNPFVNETFKPLSKERRTRWEIGTGALQAWEARHLESLADSRNVYLYTGECGDVAECCTYRVEGIGINNASVCVDFLVESFNMNTVSFRFDELTIAGFNFIGLISVEDFIYQLQASITTEGANYFDFIITENGFCFNQKATIPIENGNTGDENSFILFLDESANPENFIISGGSFWQLLISENIPNFITQVAAYTVNPLLFQILLNNSWTTIPSEEIVDGVWERTTCDTITAWRIVDSGINVIDSGTFDCIPATGEDRWLPVEVVGYNLTPRKDSNVKTVRATIQLPDRYTAQV